ncbi:MAG: YegP family protein [Balneolaceae bacterium]|nr:YegP family protein [Balneolaceae bacterium]
MSWKYYESKQSKDHRFYFNFVATNGEIVATSRMYDYEHERDETIRETISNLKGECNKEGFFLVEHILLRPEREDDKPLPICVSKDCMDCPGLRDPYSFRCLADRPILARPFRQYGVSALF